MSDCFIDFFWKPGNRPESSSYLRAAMVRNRYLPLYQYFRQAADCILDNAIKFCEENGTISIIAEKQQNTVVLKIIDDGAGIEAEHLPHIMKRFYRADKAGTTRGFGLGLSMAKRIIELHHGQLEVESQPKQGTSAIIRIPTQ